MMKISVTICLVLTFAAGPWLCCCAAVPVWLAPAAPTSNNTSNCCCSHEAGEEAPADEMPASRPCSCQDEKQPVVLALGTSLSPELGLTSALAGPAPADLLSSAAQAGKAAALPDGAVLRCCGGREILRALHILRC